MNRARRETARIVRAAAAALAAAALAGPPGALAGGAPLDFQAAVQRALANEPSAAAAAHELTAAKRDADAARAGYLPSLLFEERFVRTNVPAEAFGLKMNEERLLASDFADVDNFNKPPPINDYIATLSVSQPLFAPRVAIGSRIAAREAGAKALDLSRRREEVVYGLLSAWLEVLSARESAGVAARTVEDAREHHRVAEALERSGAGLASDVLRAKVFLARAESSGVTAAGRLALSRKALARAMGERGGADADAAGPLPPFPDAGSLEERVATALAGRSDLKAGAERARNADAGVLLEKSDYLPTAGLSGAWQADARDNPFSPDNRTWRVGVGLRWNLFDGLRREAAVGKAKAEDRRARELLRGAQDDVALQVSRAWLSVRDAAARVDIARAAAGAAEEGMRIVRSRYANQLARMIDLLDAQQAADSARVELVRSENDLLRARGDLEYASGTLLSWAGQPQGRGPGEPAERGQGR